MSADRVIRHALVTGATGFIGAQLAIRLLGDRVRVRALVRDRASAYHLSRAGIELVEGDVTNSATLQCCAADVDTVFHCAALVGPSYLPEAAYRRVNVDGTRHLLESCATSATVQRIVHVSSVGVIGPVPAGIVCDEAARTQPADAYERTKLDAERVVHRAVAHAGMPIVVARPAWVYGPTARGTRKLFELIAHRRFLVLGRGGNRRHPVWIDDLVDGLLRCATVAGIEGRTYHLAGPEILTSHDLCTIVAETVGTPIRNVFVPVPVAAVTASVASGVARLLQITPPIDYRKVDFFRRDQAYSIHKAAAELNWLPRIDFRAGASKTWRCNATSERLPQSTDRPTTPLKMRRPASR